MNQGENLCISCVNVLPCLCCCDLGLNEDIEMVYVCVYYSYCGQDVYSSRVDELRRREK